MDLSGTAWRTQNSKKRQPLEPPTSAGGETELAVRLKTTDVEVELMDACCACACVCACAERLLPELKDVHHRYELCKEKTGISHVFSSLPEGVFTQALSASRKLTRTSKF